MECNVPELERWSYRSPAGVASLEQRVKVEKLTSDFLLSHESLL